MEWIHVKGNTFCLSGVTMIGVYKLDESRCILIDSGWEWEREALKEALEREGMTPVAVIGSHVHVDHVGSHRWLQETYGAEIWMPRRGAAIAAHIGGLKLLYRGLSLDTILRFGSALHFQTDRIIGDEEDRIEVQGVPFRIHQTPGHSADHICIGTPDGVCHVGDLLLSEKFRKSARLPYHLVHELTRKSMEEMRDVEGYSAYIMSHRGVAEDIRRDVDENIALMEEITEEIWGLLTHPMTWDEVVAAVVEHNQIFTSEERKGNIYERSTQAFIDQLVDTGRVEVRVEQGIRRYYRI